jgi:outer membrane protein OmpA-like peptidoglycan-associated protein
MRLRRIVLPVIVGVVLLGGLTAVQDTVFRERIEDKLTDNAAAALSAAGLDDVEVTFTGRDGEVTAKTEAAAVEAGALVEDVSGVRVVQAFGPDGAVTGKAGSATDEADEAEATTEPEPSASAPTAEASPTPTAEEREAAQAELDRFRSISFEHNSDVLTSAGLGVVKALAATLTEHPDVTVRIEGHADITGMLAHTQDLSERRAKRVLDTLVSLGVEADRLSSQGYGETRPIVPGKQDARNRRVEFVITN